MFDFGVLAQLGERLNGIQEVRGSNPLSSTSIFHPTLSGGIFSLEAHQVFYYEITFSLFCRYLVRYQQYLKLALYFQDGIVIFFHGAK